MTCPNLAPPKLDPPANGRRASAQAATRALLFGCAAACGCGPSPPLPEGGEIGPTPQHANTQPSGGQSTDGDSASSPASDDTAKAGTSAGDEDLAGLGETCYLDFTPCRPDLKCQLYWEGANPCLWEQSRCVPFIGHAQHLDLKQAIGRRDYDRLDVREAWTQIPRRRR
ncbi:MAG: hypothetical protein V3V08_08930 [Nannocystaceae bacterium]